MDQDTFEELIKNYKPPRHWKWSEEAKLHGWPEERKAELRERMSEIGSRPKNESTKQKMREAKIGVKKSEEHRKAMSETHSKRGAIIEKLFADHPQWSRDTLFAEVKRIKENNGGVYPDWREDENKEHK